MHHLNRDLSRDFSRHFSRYLHAVVPAAILSVLVGLAFVAACASTPNVPAHVEIAWQDWTPASFERAKEEKRLLLVTVVTTWCHWCHVMDEKTWSDPEIATLLNENFVTMRVDADSHPDVAERYQEWGWPATAIMRSDASAVVEIKGFRDPATMKKLLASLIADHKAGKKIVRREPPVMPAPVMDAELSAVRQRVQKQLDHFYDDKEGGWGRGRQKYPLVAPLEQAFARVHREGEAEDAAKADDNAKEKWLKRALFTVEQERKILDPVWGGMYQYSVHGVWSEPHFEKLAFIQGWGLRSLVEAYRVNGNQADLDAARQIFAYLQGHLREPERGGKGRAYFATQDADLGTRGDVPFLSGHEYYKLDDKSRRARGEPFIDAQVFASHNGEILRGLAELYVASGDEKVRDAALSVLARLQQTHALRGGFSHRALAEDKTGQLDLEDQVAMGWALLRWGTVTGDSSLVVQGDNVAMVILNELEDKKEGGFFAHTLTEGGVRALQRRKPFKLNARAARLMLRLAWRSAGSHQAQFKAAAVRALRVFAAPEFLADQYRMVGDYLLALDDATSVPFHISVVAHEADAAGKAMYATAARIYAPGAFLEWSEPGAQYPDMGQPVVFICNESFCSPPLTDISTLVSRAPEFLP